MSIFFINRHVVKDAHTEQIKHQPHLYFYYLCVSIALAHYHAAISIDLSKPITAEDLQREKFKISCFLDDSTNNNDICPRSLKKAHIKESLQCHDESQRLQRMCRDLKVSK